MLSDKTGKIWMDGKLVDWVDANVHLLTHTLHYGSGVFEGARAYNGQIFEMTRHHKRLHASAEMMGFEIPYTVKEIDAAAISVLKANNLTEAYVRPIAWHGSEALGVSTEGNTVHLAIAAWAWGAYYHAESIALMWSDFARPAPNMALVHAKANGQYITGTVSLNKAHKLGYNDAILLDYRGYIAECTSSNIFCVKNGELFTPLPECCLNGITRQTVMAMAAEQGVLCTDKHLSPDDLLNADEIFVTGSAAEIQPVGRIDKKPFEVGPLTKKMAALYAERVRKNV